MDNRLLRNTMFEANDPLKHDVCWSDIANGWMLENEEVGLISTHRHLCEALTKMHAITGEYWTKGGDTEEYKMRVPNTWTVSANPYNGD